MAVPEILVEIAFDGASSYPFSLILDDPARGLLNTGTLAEGATFTDVTEFVTSMTIRRGASTITSNPIVSYDPGIMTITLLNDDRRFDPSNLGGPYVSAGVTQVKPVRMIRVFAIWDGNIYPLYWGYIDEWQINDTPTTSRVTLPCFDAFSLFSTYDRDASSTQGAGELPGARLERILDSITWPAEDRDISAGNTTLQATTLSANMLSEMRLTVDTEAGELYMDASNRVVFRDRNAAYAETRSNTSQGVFGDDPAELRYVDLQRAASRGDLVNYVSVARVGGTAQVVQDDGSIQTYLTQSYTRTDLLMETDAEALQQATYVLALGSEPEFHPKRMVLRPARADGSVDLFTQALARELGDRITVKRRPPGGGTPNPVTHDVFIRSIEHVVTDGGLNWTTVFGLQSASGYNFFVLDNATLGALDANRLGY